MVNGNASKFLMEVGAGLLIAAILWFFGTTGFLYVTKMDKSDFKEAEAKTDARICEIKKETKEDIDDLKRDVLREFRQINETLKSLAKEVRSQNNHPGY